MKIRKGFSIYVEEDNRYVNIHIFDEPLNKEIRHQHIRYFLDEEGQMAIFEINKTEDPGLATIRPGFGFREDEKRVLKEYCSNLYAYLFLKYEYNIRAIIVHGKEINIDEIIEELQKEGGER